MSTKDEKLLSPIEFSVKANISISRVYKMLNSGELVKKTKRKGLRTINLIPISELKKTEKYR